MAVGRSEVANALKDDAGLPVRCAVGRLRPHTGAMSFSVAVTSCSHCLVPTAFIN